MQVEFVAYGNSSTGSTKTSAAVVSDILAKKGEISQALSSDIATVRSAGAEQEGNWRRDSDKTKDEKD